MPPANYRKADSQTTLTSNLSSAGGIPRISNQSAVINGLNNLEPDTARLKSASSTVVQKDRAMDMEIQQVPWWNRRSRMERRFLILAITLLLVSVGLALALAATMYKDKLFPDPEFSGQNGNGFETTAAFTASENPTSGKLESRQTPGESSNQQGQCGNASTSYCMTPGCVQTAADILLNMDTTVDPCDDFYQFACGGFVARTVIPDDRTRMSSFSVLGDELLTQVNSHIEF